MEVGALLTLWKDFDDCNLSLTLWHSTQWKTTIRQLLFVTADTNDVHTKAAHYYCIIHTGGTFVYVNLWRVPIAICICGTVQIIWISAHYLCKSLFEHTVIQITARPLSADLHTWRGRSPGLLSEPTEGLISTFLEFGSSPGLIQTQISCVRDRDVIFVLSLCLFSLSGSHFPCSTMCWLWLLDLV